MEEYWKPVVGYEGMYLCSSHGNVKSLEIRVRCKNYTRVRPSKMISQHKSNCGYMRVTIYKNGVRKYISVHRLIAQAFWPLSEFIGACVNHIDGNKTNNHFRNLEWVTYSENEKHSYRIGLKRADGDHNGRRKEWLKKQHAI